MVGDWPSLANRVISGTAEKVEKHVSSMLVSSGIVSETVLEVVLLREGLGRDGVSSVGKPLELVGLFAVDMAGEGARLVIDGGGICSRAEVGVGFVAVIGSGFSIGVLKGVSEATLGVKSSGRAFSLSISMMTFEGATGVCCTSLKIASISGSAAVLCMDLLAARLVSPTSEMKGELGGLASSQIMMESFCIPAAIKEYVELFDTAYDRNGVA